MRGWQVTKTLLLLFTGQGEQNTVIDGPAWAPGTEPKPLPLTWRSRGRVRLRAHAREVPQPDAPVVARYRSVGRLDWASPAMVGYGTAGSTAHSVARSAFVRRSKVAVGLVVRAHLAAPRPFTAGASAAPSGAARQSRAYLPGDLDPAKLAAWQRRADDEIAAALALMD